jgi:hypothetical protein
VAAICLALFSGLACGSTNRLRTASQAGTDPGGVPGSRVSPSPKALPGTHAQAGTHARTTSASSTPSSDSGSATAAFTQTVLPASTPISSARYHQAIVSAVQKGGKTAQIAEVFAGCIQKILENAGIQTVAEAERIKQNPSSDKPVARYALQCLAASAP